MVASTAAPPVDTTFCGWPGARSARAQRNLYCDVAHVGDEMPKVRTGALNAKRQAVVAATDVAAIGAAAPHKAYPVSDVPSDLAQLVKALAESGLQR